MVDRRCCAHAPFCAKTVERALWYQGFRFSERLSSTMGDQRSVMLVPLLPSRAGRFCELAIPSASTVRFNTWAA